MQSWTALVVNGLTTNKAVKIVKGVFRNQSSIEDGALAKIVNGGQ